MRYKVPPIKLRRPTVPVAVDAVIIHRKKVVLVKRGTKPFRGSYVLPGGFVIPGQTTKETCIRETKEEAGLDVKVIRFIGVYDNPYRDPRGHTVSVVYLCKSTGGRLKAGSDAAEAKWFSQKEIENLDLGFDHKQILKDVGVIK